MKFRRLHLVTACMRPENLPIIGRTIAERLHTPWTWWIVLDGRHVEHCAYEPDPGTSTVIMWAKPASHGFACGALRNAAIDQIQSGWVYALDDDTILHEHLWTFIIAGWPADLLGFVTLNRSGKIHSYADPALAVDVASFMWRKEAYPSARFEPFGMDSDTILYRQLYHETPSERRHITMFPAGYHNYLRPA